MRGNHHLTRRALWLGTALAAVLWTLHSSAAQAPRIPPTSGAGRVSELPVFEPDPLWSQALPNKWVTGQVGGVAVDAHDNVWVFHRPASIPDGEKAAALTPPQAECCIPAPSVLEFAPDGTVCDADKYFWVQAESLAAAALLAIRTGEAAPWSDYERLWAYSWTHLVDHRHGAWFRILTSDNRAYSDEKSPAGKTDYHTMGACWDVLRAMGELQAPSRADA